MDPISVVVAALAAGASAAGGSAVGAAAEDAYRSLREQVLARFRGNDRAGQVVQEHAEDPSTWQVPLRRLLEQSGISAEDGVVRTAQHVLALVDAGGTRTGRYVVDARGAQGVTIGDNAHVTQTFTVPPRDA